MLLRALYKEPLIPSIGAWLMRCDCFRRNVDPCFDRNAISSVHGNLRAPVTSTFSLVEASKVGIVNFVKHSPDVIAMAQERLLYLEPSLLSLLKSKEYLFSNAARPRPTGSIPYARNRPEHILVP